MSLITTTDEFPLVPPGPHLRPAASPAAVSPRRALAVVALMLLPLPFLTATRYLGSGDLHSATEVVGAVIGLVAGVTFIQRFVALDDHAHLYFGLAFFANASVDLVHGLMPFLASRGVLDVPAETLDRVVPGTYLAGRTVAAVVLLAAPFLAARSRGRVGPRHAWRLSGLVVLGGAALSAVLFLLPPPRVLFPAQVIGRPADLVVAIVFAAAAIGLYRWHRRTGDPMTWWVAVAAGAGAVGQAWMSLSRVLYDIHFDAAHGYKVLGYLLPLLGLSLYQVRLIAQREALADDLRRHTAQLEAANAELERANRIKSDFVSVVSHELRTPLTAIVGFASTMAEFWDETPDAEKHQHIEIIERQSVRLGRLIDDLLAMSRLEAGTLDTTPGDVDVGAIARRVVRDLGERVPRVEVDIPPGTLVRGDAGHIEQILVNYIANAGRYGAPPIRVTTEYGQPGAVTVAVSDAGPGVPDDFRDQLFEKFSQADSGPTRRSQGTGLGLAIVRGLARAQGGDAWYEPNEPHGSRFLFRLPGGRAP